MNPYSRWSRGNVSGIAQTLGHLAWASAHHVRHTDEPTSHQVKNSGANRI